MSTTPHVKRRLTCEMQGSVILELQAIGDPACFGIKVGGVAVLVPTPQSFNDLDVRIIDDAVQRVVKETVIRAEGASRSSIHDFAFALFKKGLEVTEDTGVRFCIAVKS